MTPQIPEERFTMIDWQTFAIVSDTLPPQDPNDDDEEDEEENRTDEPPLREPDED
jgi:hypothetical protein